MAKKHKVTEEEAVNAVATALGITQKDIDNANKLTFSQKEVTIAIPKELRLGQAIVNALGQLHKENPTITEEPSTALYYVSDEELQKAIDSFHKPYGFGSR
jgi:hypothetical protein